MAACMGRVVVMGFIVACIHVALGEAADWKQATATWYGSPDGDGSEGGACGYGSTVKAMPFASRVTAVSPDLFRGGEGCGECYQVKCEENSLCSDTPVNVVVTDECPGCFSNHFDLSGTAFSGIAVTPAKSSDLRNEGVLPILFQRVPCEYPGKKVTFHVNEGSTDHWFSVLIEYEDGDGDLQEVDLQQVKCEENSLCSDTPVNVVVTDECPGCFSNHFDLSGTAFSGIAVTPAKSSDLRNEGVLPILFQRVPCEYPGKKVTFHVNEGSTDHWFSVLIEYEDGDGDLQEVDLQQSNSTVWEGLKQTWGANWALDEGPLKSPFSIRLKSLSSGSTLTAYNVIPQNWAPNSVYTSMVNYD